MRRDPDLPRIARWLVRLSPVPRDRRDEVLSDLRELFVTRASARGRAYAKHRAYRDVLSLWRVPSSAAPKLDRHRLAYIGDALFDLKYAVRLFVRRPGILLLTIIGLALGLGVATATFSIMNVAFLRSEGIENPDRLPGVLRMASRSVYPNWKYDDFLRVREGSTTMRVEAALSDGATFRLTSAFEDLPSSPLAFVSGGFFQVTGGRAVTGRTLIQADERYDGAPPVVVAYRFWVDRLNGDPSIIGQTVWVGRTSATIVGVMQRGFTASPDGRTVLWMPITAYGAVYGARPNERMPRISVEVFGRLLPGVTLSTAEAQLSGVAASLPRVAGQEPELRVRLDPGAGLGRTKSSSGFMNPFVVVFVIGLVLVLAAANVATVLIATAMSRDREIGVRLALGASRGRVLRQLVTEGLALCVPGSALGLAFTFWAVPVIATMLRAPDGLDLAPDLNVYLFLAVATLLVGIAAGLAPAWHGRGADLLTPLKDAGAKPERPAPRRLRSGLILVQATGSIVLIVLATLFVRATWRASQIDVGFDPRGLYAASASFGRSDARVDRSRAYWERALAQLPEIQGLRSACLTEYPPFGRAIRTTSRVEGTTRVVTYLNRTHANYFETVGLRILSGRTYSAEEVKAAAPVALVSESVARRYWGDESPLGDTIQRVDESSRATIIGVVADAITARLHERSAAAVYQPLEPKAESVGRLIFRVSDTKAGPQRVREVLQHIDPDANVSITRIADDLRREQDLPRVLATLAGFVGSMAIVLSIIGIYGLTASIVGQRTAEIGLRIALGGDRKDVIRLLLWDSLRPVGAGIILGTGAAVVAGHFVSRLLFGVPPHDPLALIAGAVVLITAAGLAAFFPTRRAASVDPAFVLRQS